MDLIHVWGDATSNRFLRSISTESYKTSSWLKFLLSVVPTAGTLLKGKLCGWKGPVAPPFSNREVYTTAQTVTW